MNDCALLAQARALVVRVESVRDLVDLTAHRSAAPALPIPTHHHHHAHDHTHHPPTCTVTAPSNPLCARACVRIPS